MTLLKNKKGIALNFYEAGTIVTKTPANQELTLALDTKYPVDGSVKITLDLAEAESFALSLRIPGWCREAKIMVNGVSEPVNPGYTTIERTWQSGDVVQLDMDIQVERILPPMGADNEELFAAYRRGPIVLAADARLVLRAAVGLDIL